MNTLNASGEQKTARFGTAAFLAGLAALGLCGYFASALMVDRTSTAVSVEQAVPAPGGCVGCADKATMRAFAHRDKSGETADAVSSGNERNSPAASQDHHP